ncbi:MAG TPA: winged helix-turn-helix domain-containing protein [Candidatus Limnocylindria bacterium]|nr:winged helix-turn-helix domain-containing protein [Candidatus Limnocylindria bacterium]
MSSKSPVPDYDLDERMELTSADQVRAIGHPLRTTILGLLHERAATVTEMATAVGRPKSTVAHHVNVLQRAGLVQVVRTRRVRAIDERYYGRTARMFYVGVGKRSGDGSLPLDFNDFDVAASESQAAYESHQLWSFIRHARLPREQVAEFWARGMDLVQEFERLPRSGAVTYGFVAGVYPIPDYPALPDPEEV